MNNFLRLTIFIIFSNIITVNSFAETMFIDNFNDASQWRYIADDVMGGISKGSVEFKRIQESSIAILKGNVTTENNGGFIQIRRDLRDIKELNILI